MLEKPRNWSHACRLYNNMRLSAEDLILFADQCAPLMSDIARGMVEKARLEFEERTSNN